MDRNRLAWWGVVVAGHGLALLIVLGQAVTAQQTSNAGAQSYAENCAICHGDLREGNLPDFPPLAGIKRQMNDKKLAAIIHDGKAPMPGFPEVQGAELAALLQYLGSAGPAVNSAGKKTETSGPVAAGEALFHQNCAFCHGRDAMGGETGPDLTQSKLVLSDKTGEKIAQGSIAHVSPGWSRSISRAVHGGYCSRSKWPGRSPSLRSLRSPHRSD